MSTNSLNLVLVALENILKVLVSHMTHIRISFCYMLLGYRLHLRLGLSRDAWIYDWNIIDEEATIRYHWRFILMMISLEHVTLVDRMIDGCLVDWFDNRDLLQRYRCSWLRKNWKILRLYVALIHVTKVVDDELPWHLFNELLA